MQHATNTCTRHLSAITAVIVLALGTAACGSDDDSAADTSSPPAAAAVTTSAPTTETLATTAAPVATEAPTTEAPTTEAPTSEASATTGAADTNSPAAGDATVAVSETDLGTILVDGEGRTLYMFAPDAQGPSTCQDTCLATWPSLTGPATAGDGVDAAMLATAARSDDGTEQVTYDGWPLYHFANDAAPGDINGQGVGDVWYVVDPSGAPIGMAAG